MTISNATLSTDIYSAVRTAIVNASITVSYNSTTISASVVPAYNDEDTSVPQIVVYDSEYDEAEYKFGSNHGKKLINVLVECYFTKGRGTSEMKDKVINAIKDTTFDGMELVAVATDTAFINPNEQKYHLVGINFTFDRE
jgi:hypothetical protein